MERRVIRLRQLAILALALFLVPVAHAPGQTVSFTLPPSLEAGQSFVYQITLSGFTGNFSGSFWFGGYELCGWIANIRATSPPVSIYCWSNVPLVLEGQTVSTMLNAGTTYYQGPNVLIDATTGSGGSAPRPT